MVVGQLQVVHAEGMSVDIAVGRIVGWQLDKLGGWDSVQEEEVPVGVDQLLNKMGVAVVQVDWEHWIFL